MKLIDLCERGYVPDVLARAGIRRLVNERLVEEQQRRRDARAREAWLSALRVSPIAIETPAANHQHYEVPTEFFKLHLGPRLKYSCCLFETGRETLAEAEEAMLDLYARRAGLRDGQRVLDLGCGWGSLSLWLAQRYPASEIVGLSNSATQREFIEQRARALGLSNLRIITANIAEFDFPADGIERGFDRVLSIEMFEHMRNYGLLLEKIAGWLVPDGKLFVHIFAHRTLSYPFEDRDASDWMSRHFFTGGLMPSQDLLGHFQSHLHLRQQWWLPGTHYEHTANHWLARLDANRDAVLPVLREGYGSGEAAIRLQRWRMFYMAVAEMFGYAGGAEWGVGHYLFAPCKTS